MGALLALCMVVGMLPVGALAAEEVITGTCGDSMTWSLDLGTGAMTISGSGDMKGYSDGYYGGGAPWKDHMASITSVVVEEGVVTIGTYAFFQATNLTRVSLPYGLLRIGAYAFCGCSNLIDVELPDSLMRIDAAAFIGIGATEIKLPHSLIRIDENALQDCSMEEITIPYGASQADYRAIFSTDIQNFHAEPDNPVYTSVDGVLFSKDMKTLVVYPSANPRTSYAIPEGVTTVRRNLCGPDDLTFPASFMAFEDFEGPRSLDSSNYTVAAGNTAFSSRDGVLFDKDGTTLIRYPIGRTDTSYQVPDGVTTVGPYGFTDAASLTSITIPTSVTNLSLEYGSFDGCESLSDIYFEGSPFQWSLIDGTAQGFTDPMDPNHTVNVHFGAEDETFTVRYAPGEGAVRDDSMSPSIAARGDAVALSACGGYYTAPAGKRFKSWEINGEEYLPGMTYTLTADVTATALWEDSSLPSGRCGEDITWRFDAATGTLTISGSGEMLYPTGGCVPWLEMRPSITRVVVEEGITTLGDSAFAECTQLVDVSLASSITRFKKDAFFGCSALEAIELPQGLADLGWRTFHGCGVLERIVLPDALTSIDSSVFRGCSSLREINIPDGVTSIGEESFENCTSLQSIAIPNVKTIGRYAFRDCTALESVTLEEGLERIGDGAFTNCTALRNIVFPGSVQQYCQFIGCDNLDTVTVKQGISTVHFSGCDSLNTLHLPESLNYLTILSGPAPSEIYYAGSRVQWQQIARTFRDNSGNSAPWPNVTMHYGNADVTYDRNGGTDGMPMMFIQKNTSLTLPVCRFIAPEGKTFKAWEINGQEYQPGDSYLIEDDTVLKALWEDSTGPEDPEPVSGTVAKGTYMDADGNTQSYEEVFQITMTPQGGEMSAGNYYLPGDIDLVSDIIVSSGTVRLDLAGHILRGTGTGAVITVNEDASLEIYDSSSNADNTAHPKHYYVIDSDTGNWLIDDSGSTEHFIEGGVIAASTSISITLERSAVATLYAGTICGGTGVCANASAGSKNAASFRMFGGRVSGCTTGDWAIKANEFIMTGGAVEKNAGAGVYVNVNFALRQGKISDNGGTGVIVIENFDETPAQGYMYGGEIRNNNLGLNVHASTFTMIDGTIAGNCGGVTLGTNYHLSGPPNKGTFTMKGGTITQNHSVHSGGGVYAQTGIFIMEGGTISGNIADECGGGVSVIDNGVFEMRGGTIKENYAAQHGGGIYSNAAFYLSGSVAIFDNTSFGDTKNNVYLEGPCILFPGALSSAEKIGVSSAGPGVFTDGWSVRMGDTDPADYFVSEMDGYKVCPLASDDTTEGALVLLSHQATFMADGVQVGAVTFFRGDTTLEEPAVPAKAHYDGAWESYDLAAATEDITVNAVYTLNDDHTGFETPVVTAPTCTEGGYTTYTCSVCGNVRRGDETEALGHDYQHDPDRSEAPTPGHDGFDYYECSRCGDSYERPIVAPLVTHTATFKIGDEIIGQIVFEEGSATLAEPAIPERANYVGQWEPYDLAAARSDITIQGHYTPVDPDAVADVGGGAEVEYQNGIVTIDLSAKAASRTIKVVSQKTKPLDVVLVLDQSGSMADSLTNRGRQSKRDALVDCANSFVQSLYENAVASGADHRVALVGFAYSAYNRGNYKNTGLLTTVGGQNVRYDRIKESDLRSALLPINSGGRINTNVLAGIRSIQADGATAADLGLRVARDVFAANPNEDARERIVIFITDGTPTSWGEESALVRQTAAAAITVANTIKNGQSAKIYSVGVHANADPTASFTAAKDGITTDRRGEFSSYDFNRFLHAVSSNYPAAAAMDNMGVGNKNGGYYMGVRDTGNLGSIFTNILYSTVYELKTFDKATLNYTLSKEFTLTMEQELALREQLQQELGLADADIQIDRDADGTTRMTFRNVRVKEVYGEDGALYYEASVRFQVSANEKTLAGGNITTGSGDVSYEDSAVTEVGASTVTIPSNRSVIAFTINGQVYRLCDVAQGETITVPETELASWSVPEGTAAEAGYAVFEANHAQDQKYTIVWSINGKDTVQRYALGEVIAPPEVPAREGYDFTGWSRTIPYTMPAYNLVCEAIYSPAHVHSFEAAYQTGSCKTGLTTVFRCACGETREEQAEPMEHNFTAVLADNGSVGTALEKVVCTKCGHSEEQNINFKVSYSSGWKTTVLDLNLLQNEVNVTEPEDEIEMRFFVGDDGGRRYTVTRIDSDGHRTTYQTRSEDGYLVFRANHFSVYVLSELDETTSQPTEEVDYEEAVDILDNKVEAKPTAPIESGSQGGGTQGGSTGGVSGGSTTTEPEPEPAVTFSDVEEGSFYANAVAWAVEREITNGTGEGRFSPDAACTRSQMVTFLWRAAGKPEPTATTCAFADISEEAEYYKAVLWAVEQGITNGTATDTFSPLKSCTRGEMVTFLYRYTKSPETSGILRFSDVPEDAFFAAAALWAVEQGVTKGTSETTFSPQAICTRAQMVTFLYRLLGGKA